MGGSLRVIRFDAIILSKRKVIVVHLKGSGSEQNKCPGQLLAISILRVTYFLFFYGRRFCSYSAIICFSIDKVSILE